MEFEEIYKVYWDRVLRMCMGYVNHNDSAKDLAQDAFVLVYQNLSKFKYQSDIGTWIFKIATNTCLKHLKKESRLNNIDINILSATSESLNTDNEIQKLYQFISELPEIDRIVILLELENLKQFEIANITGLSESNVRVKIHRIKQKLSKRFKSNES